MGGRKAAREEGRERVCVRVFECVRFHLLHVKCEAESFINTRAHTHTHIHTFKHTHIHTYAHTHIHKDRKRPCSLIVPLAVAYLRAPDNSNGTHHIAASHRQLPRQRNNHATVPSDGSSGRRRCVCVRVVLCCVLRVLCVCVRERGCDCELCLCVGTCVCLSLCPFPSLCRPVSKCSSFSLRICTCGQSDPCSA